MKKFALHKTVMLVAALAIGSAGIAGDALARGGGRRRAAVADLVEAAVAAATAAVALVVAA